MKRLVDNLRAGLVALPKGVAWPAEVIGQQGANFTLRLVDIPDFVDGAATTLTEGTPPTPLVMGIGYEDFTVAQKGAYVQITDIARFQMQAGHDPDKAAMEKIARLAAQTVDNIALTAELAAGVDVSTSAALSTATILNAKAVLENRNVAPVNGTYYALAHPFALSGLQREAGLNGYVDVSAQAQAGTVTAGAIGQYRGVTFIPSTRITPALGPAITLATSDNLDDIIDTTTAHGFAAGDAVRFTSLTGGTGLTVDTTYYVVATSLGSTTFRVAATRGGTPLGFSTDITAGTVKTFNYPVIFLGANSVAVGDVSTIEFFRTAAPDSANPLAQYTTAGFKGILGAKVVSLPETVTAGTNDAAVPRIWIATVQDGTTL